MCPQSTYGLQAPTPGHYAPPTRVHTLPLPFRGSPLLHIDMRTTSVQQRHIVDFRLVQTACQAALSDRHPLLKGVLPCRVLYRALDPAQRQHGQARHCNVQTDRRMRQQASHPRLPYTSSALLVNAGKRQLPNAKPTLPTLPPCSLSNELLDSPTHTRLTRTLSVPLAQHPRTCRWAHGLLSTQSNSGPVVTHSCGPAGSTPIGLRPIPVQWITVRTRSVVRGILPRRPPAAHPYP